MEFQVPKFIERQPVIIWTITFRQFMFLALAAGGLGILYLILPSRLLFFFIAFWVLVFSFFAIFVKIGGRPFSVVLVNFFRYTFSSKIYLWQRKAAPPRLLKKTSLAPVKKEAIPGVALKVTERSYLGEMAKKIETTT
jgi:hypothetical protein